MLILTEKLPTSQRDSIIEKINAVSHNLGVQPNWLMAVMEFESGLNPSAVNPYSGAVGLIQFMPSTAQAVGTSVEQLRTMGFLDQLKYVERYYDRFKNKVNSFQDLYFATFYPIAIGKADSYVLGSHKGEETIRRIAEQNPIFDPEKKGYVTVSDVKAGLLKKIPSDYVSYLVTKKKSATAFLLMGALLLAFIIKK